MQILFDNQKPQLDALTLGALGRLMAEWGQPAYRAKQIFGWLHRQRVRDMDAMANLPAALRQRLCEHFTLGRGVTELARRGAGGTAKLLVRLADGNRVETVLMRYKHGYSVCVSSQVGCRMGCAFCASSTPGEGFAAGLVRNLSAAEMAGQLYLAEEDLNSSEPGARVTHLVLMGIGEPLDNLPAVLDFYHIVTSDAGAGLSGRNISLSTCGLVPGIDALAAEKLPLTLSVSLHAASDATRERLMPVARRWPLSELMAACKRYRAATGRRVSYEYTLFAGVNDSAADAAALAALLRGQDAHLNLIAANRVPGSAFGPPPHEAVRAFCGEMNRLGVVTTVRRSLGDDIDAACGQLRRGRAETLQSTPGTAYPQRG